MVEPVDPPRDERLLLLAHEVSEVPTISALLHSATVRVDDIAWDRRGRRLVLLVNRFRWEAGDCTRVRSALRIESVVAVQRRRWTVTTPSDPGVDVLELLAFVAEDEFVTLHFAGGAKLRVTIECPDMILEDLSAPWRASRQPVHS